MGQIHLRGVAEYPQRESVTCPNFSTGRFRDLRTLERIVFPQFRSSLVILCLIVFGMHLTCTVAQPPVDLESVRSAALDAWRRDETEVRNLQVRFQWDLVDGPTGGEKRIARQFWTLGADASMDLKFARMENPDFPDSTSFEIANPKYQFDVDLKKSSQDSVLAELRMATPSGSVQPPDNWARHWDVLKSRFQFGSIPLTELMTSPDFECLDVRADGKKNECLRITFGYHGSKGVWRIPGGTYRIWINPTESYRLEKLEFGFPNSTKTETCDIRYFDPDDLPTPREVIYRADTTEDISLQTWTIERPEPLQISAEEFYLPHYGISEDVLETLSPDPWPRRTLLLAGTVFLLIGLWLVRRHSQPVRPSAES